MKMILVFLISFLLFVVSVGAFENQTEYELQEESEDAFTIFINSGASERNFCCLFASKYCSTPCNGRKCSATCHVACGYEGMFKCGGVRCWTASPDSCSPGPSTPATDFRCEAGWKRHGDHCFRLFTDRRNYLEANNQCVLGGGFLASVKDQEDQDALFNFAAKGGAWIGGQDFLDEGRFAWLQDGTEIDGVFGNWRAGQPNNILDNQHCIWMRPDGSWDDVTCKRVENYICQKKATEMV